MNTNHPTLNVQVDDEKLMPQYGNDTDAGLDVFAAEAVEIPPGEHRKVHTGLRVEMPAGYVGLVWDRSSMAAKQNCTTIGGVLDSGYRGEWIIMLHNLGKEPVRIEKYQKFAQVLIQPVEHVTIQAVEELADSDRGKGGFGSTGK